MSKRITSRGIIIENDYVYGMFRRKIGKDGTIKEYYAIPGGGLDGNETIEETVIRELKEEFSVDVKINGYLGQDIDEKGITNFFRCEIIGGTPELGGEELERFSDSNYYEIRKVPLKDIDNVDIKFKDMIIKACNEEYINVPNIKKYDKNVKTA